jgi:TonB family protein
MPDVPKNARRTIRGHVKVWVRVIVDQDGSVFAAAPDRTGPSRYFERLAIEAAKKWTFPPADAPQRRIMQVQFDFSRDAITGHAIAPH